MRKSMWIGFLFAGVCLYFAFRGISFQQMFAAFRQANPWPILLCLILYFVEYLVRSERWAILIRTIRPIPAKELFWPMIIGFFANNVLPLRMGELVRAHVCGSKFKISRTASLGSIFLERICDTISFLTTFLVASLFCEFPHYMEKGAWLLGGGCITAILMLILIRQHEKRFHAVLEWSPLSENWTGRLKHLVGQFIHSTSGITQPRYVAEAMALSVIIWVIEGSFLYLVGLSFGIPLPYAGAFFLLFALGLSVTLPQAPGYVGTFELFGVTALSLLGIPKEQGLPVILAIHGIQFILISILGTIGLWREGLTMSSLTQTNSA